MTQVETTAETTSRFINSWKQNSERLADELISVHNETHRKADLYSFLVTFKGLIDTKTRRPIKDFILQDTDIQKTEFKIFEKLETFAKEEEGIAIWISPPSNEYPCAKAIFSRIVYDLEGKKHLANSAILFGDKNTDCRDIIPIQTKNKEGVRETLFYVDETDEYTIPNIIKKIQKYTQIDLNKITDKNLNQAKTFARMIEEGQSPKDIVYKMQKTGFLGENPISCPTFGSASDILASNSRIFSFVGYEFRPGVCRVCKKHTHVGPCSICKECEKKLS